MPRRTIVRAGCRDGRSAAAGTAMVTLSAKRGRMDGFGRYEKPEYERRFLLREIPAGVYGPRRINDLYIRGTRLRLRKVEDPAGGNEMLKLGHKRRPNPSDPTLVMHTSMYLAESEYSVLAALDADQLSKTRYRLDLDGGEVAVDVFGADLAGLLLLEAAFCEPGPMEAFAPPPHVGAEVSGYEGFTGGNLARLDASGYLELRASVG